MEGSLFTHVRFGQGDGLGLRPTYTSTANTTAFQVSGVSDADSSFAVLAQAWYQLKVPLPRGGVKAQSKEHVHLTFRQDRPVRLLRARTPRRTTSRRGSSTTPSCTTRCSIPAATSAPTAAASRPAPSSSTPTNTTNRAPGPVARRLRLRPRRQFLRLARQALHDRAGRHHLAHQPPAGQLPRLPVEQRPRHGLRQHRAPPLRHRHVDRPESQRLGDGVRPLRPPGRRQVRFDRALTVGAEIAGNAWGRSADSLGAAFGLLRTSSDYRRDSVALDLDGDGALDPRASANERIAELYCRYRVNERFELTPDFQLIQRPGGDGGAPSIKVVGLRAKVGF
ncbi:MAG: carbohydrate porin [Rhodocyclaceae bacterium]|nr:carbohydrate porin [Rhodocyclaceae bacterium]